VLADGDFREAAMGRSHVALHEYGATGQKISTVSKATCELHVAYQGGTDRSVRAFAVVDELLYVLENSNEERLLAMPVAGGTPLTFSLEAALGTPQYHVEALAPGETSLFVLVSEGTSQAVVEVPCCGGTPTLVTRLPDGSSGRVNAFAMDPSGKELLIAQSSTTLDATSYTTVVVVNRATGASRKLLDEIVAGDEFALRAGQLFAVRPQGISVASVTGCGWQPWATSPFEAVAHTAINQDRIFWAEQYPSLTVSRIFAQGAAGSPPVRLVETSGPITWLAADEAHVYWLEYESISGPTLGASRLMRIDAR
jgi:hypothetical protein